MRTFTIIVLIALAGFALSAFVIYQGAKTPVFVASVQEPPIPPYKHFIAAQGIIESVYKNIPLGASFSDIITDIYVFVGDIVQKGDPLFKTDTRHLEAQLNEARKDLAVAREDYNNQELQFSYYEHLSDKSAVSKVAYTNAEYAKKIAYQRLEKAQATVDTYLTDIERAYTRAPLDGEVLQVNIRIGQYAIQTSPTNLPLILFGDTDYYHIRIDIDEEDAWRYIDEAPAVAYVRGNRNIHIPLEYVYIEPYIIAKRSLTGNDTERVDTRVLQVVYRGKKDSTPLYLGQLLDVYLQAKPQEVAK